jgi:hypothetical protein
MDTQAQDITKAITSATLRFQARLMKLDVTASYLSCSTNYAKRLAEKAGAVRRLGASWLCDRVVLDEYLSTRTDNLADPDEVRAWRGGKA